MSVVLLVLGAAVGAPLRYLTDRAVQARHGSPFPWGTLAVNVVGSLLLGVLVGGAAAGGVPEAVLTAGGAGFCGALTTYSTVSYETVRLAEEAMPVRALLYAAVSVLVGLGAAWVGVLTGTAVWS